MLKVISNDIYLFSISVYVGVCLALTPWLNVDSLVIPKVVILFCAAMYLLPLLLVDLKIFLNYRMFKILFFNLVIEKCFYRAEIFF